MWPSILVPMFHVFMPGGCILQGWYLGDFPSGEGVRGSYASTHTQTHTIPCLHAQAPSNSDAGTGYGACDDERQFRRWKADSITFRNKLGVSPSFSPWTSRPGFAARGLRLTPRTKDIIDCVAIQVMKTKNLPLTEMESGMKGMFLDVSQSLHRKAYTQAGVNRCLTTSSVLYSYEHDRLVTPPELLYFQGYPRTLKIPPSLSSAELRDLAGEGMTLPCLAMVLWAIWTTVDLYPNGTPDEWSGFERV